MHISLVFYLVNSITLISCLFHLTDLLGQFVNLMNGEPHENKVEAEQAQTEVAVVSEHESHKLSKREALLSIV